MQAVLILQFALLALFTGSLAIPVSNSEQLRDESNEVHELKPQQHSSFRKARPNKIPSWRRFSKKDWIIWRFLKTYGYIPAGDRYPRKDILQSGLWKYASWHGAKMGKKMFMRSAIPTFERRIVSSLGHPRCGDPDIGKGRFLQLKLKDRRRGRNRFKRYAAQTPWGKNTLTYKIESFDDDLPQTVQRQEIAKAFKLWTDASELAVSEVQGSATADINIQFVAGSHSDSTPFDGPGFVVAHAFYPEDGRIHFDSDEQFTTGGEANKVNLLSIAAHEIGHALGLGHSAQPDAVMYSQYQPYSANFALTQDDINGVQYLYPSNNAGECVDEFWCEDILKEECPFFPGYCKKFCETC